MTKILHKVMCWYLALFMTFSSTLALAQSQSQELSTESNSTIKIRSLNSENLDPVSNHMSSLPPPRLYEMGSSEGIYYNVHVLGAVMYPGMYRFASSERVTDAIKYAGGILPNGSQRRIHLRRVGGGQVIDLFSYKYKGNLNNNPYLAENDVIFVPSKAGEIAVEGTVNRPGKYEIIKPISVKAAIEMASGFTVGRSTQEPIRIIRFDEQERKQVLDVSNDATSLSRTLVYKGDVVVVPHVLTVGKKFDYNVNRIPGDNMFYPTGDDKVYVIGAVTNPGSFNFLPSASYKQYMNMAVPTKYAKVRNVRVLTREGKRFAVKNNTVLNPGDTLYVPERYWKADTVVSWLTSITSLTLSTIVIVDRFK